MSPPQRQNLPLPREIRDQIFSHLLTAENVEHRSAAPAQPGDIVNLNDFDMNRPCNFSELSKLVSVSKTFAAEASETFFRNNFVLIHCRSLWLEDLVRAFQVPIVRVDGLHDSEFKHWTMKLDISIPHSSTNIHRNSYDPFDVVILAKDMPLFCRALRWAFLGFEQTANLTLPDPIKPLLYRFAPPTDNERASIDIHCRSLQGQGIAGAVTRSLTPAMEKSILEPLQHCYCGDLAISVTGSLAGDEYWTQLLRDSVAPEEIWMSAMAWQLVEAMADARSIVADLYAKGQMVQVYSIVDSVSEQIRYCSLLTASGSYAPDPLRRSFLSGITEPLTRAMLIQGDLLAYGFTAGLRSSSFDTTLGTIAKWNDWRCDCSDNIVDRAGSLNIRMMPFIDGKLVHPNDVWTNLVYKAINFLQQRDDPEDDVSFYAFLEAFVRMERLSEVFPNNEFYGETVAIFKDMMDNVFSLPPCDEAIEELFVKLRGIGLDNLSFTSTCALNYRFPSHIKGWVDTKGEEEKRVRDMSA